ncbi:MAG TPA: DUF4870 domain-containing protein [Streptosporangiaceae bacterium]|nr:DUF4870 domain-containing protein [Streptosporangiaceae bacterium]
MTGKQAPEAGAAGAGAAGAGAAEEGAAGKRAARDRDISSVTFGYLGAIVLGPVVPVAVYLLRSRRSPVLRYHAAAAVNRSPTAALYAVCCLILGGLLMLDSITVALLVALPVAVAIWASMLRYPIRGLWAAGRGEEHEVPDWICAHIVS